MKKTILKFGVFSILVLLISINLSIDQKTESIDINLEQEAMACNIIPEGPDDYCWEIHYYTPYDWDCFPNGIWSCYI